MFNTIVLDVSTSCWEIIAEQSEINNKSNIINKYTVNNAIVVSIK
jgi:hypothetical protein